MSHLRFSLKKQKQQQQKSKYCAIVVISTSRVRILVYSVFAIKTIRLRMHVDPDQLAFEEANCSGSALCDIKYVVCIINLYQVM